MIPALLALVVAWAAMAFGAVYSWAIAPVGVSVVALAAWQCRPSEGRIPRIVIAGACLLLAPLALQLIPLPIATLERVSPAARGFLSYFDVAIANGISAHHAISIDPHSTMRALVYLGEHYVVDLAAGLTLAEGVRRGSPAAAPLARGVSSAVRFLERRARA